MDKITLKDYHDSLSDPQKELRQKIAEGCKASSSAVYRWLKRETSPTALQREKIAEIIGVSESQMDFSKKN